jgi:hypothetical protein
MDAPASFVFAKETVTLLITLSTGVIGLYATFAKESDASKPRKVGWLMTVAWAILVLSIAFGLFSLMTLTGTLATGTGAGCPAPRSSTSSPAAKPSPVEGIAKDGAVGAPSSSTAEEDIRPTASHSSSKSGGRALNSPTQPRAEDIYCSNIRIPAFLQVVTFFVGMVSLGIAISRREFTHQSGQTQA